ncbi:MAG: hypothetical protein ACFCUE_03075 [Candidatus Bathyarchaeia archaeon]|jgi:hypothetical protein
MPNYIVNSAILRSGKDPKTCATGAAKMLTSGQIKDISVKSCYCCTNENRVAFVVNAPSQDAVLEVAEKIDLPIASILEVQEVQPK